MAADQGVLDMTRLNWIAVAAGVTAMVATAPAAAVTERGSGGGAQQPLSVCADLDAAMSKDAALARTVRSVRAEFANQKATKTEWSMRPTEPPT